MALRFLEGFENRQHFNFWERSYASYTGAALTSVGAGRMFGGAWRHNQVSQLITRAVVGAVENTWILQFAVQKSASESFGTSVPAIALQNSVGDQLELRFVDPAAPDVGGYQIQVRRGATVLGTTRVFQASTHAQFGWRVFQLKATIRTGTNGSFELRSFNSLGNMTVELGPTASVNTANQGTDGADRLRMAVATATSNSFMAFDDIVLMDDTGTVNNNFTTAPVMVMGARPNADVAGELDWVPSSGVNHFALVQDGATLPAQTDEVTSDVVGDVDLYGCDQITLDLAPTVAPPTVLGIMVDVEGLMKTSGARTVRVRVKDSTNQADGAVDMVFNDTAKISRHEIMEQNPTGTPAPWTVATLKTIEMGPKLTA